MMDDNITQDTWYADRCNHFEDLSKAFWLLDNISFQNYMKIPLSLVKVSYLLDKSSYKNYK